MELIYKELFPSLATFDTRPYWLLVKRRGHRVHRGQRTVTRRPSSSMHRWSDALMCWALRAAIQDDTWS